MDNDIKLRCIYQINKLKGVDFLLATIGFGAAPTIRGIKPSNLLTLTTRKGLLNNWIKYRKYILDIFNLKCTILSKRPNSQTVLLYREGNLINHLKKPCNHQYLVQNGYDLDINNAFNKIKSNFDKSFPHEIGVFLGIPIEDIEGFIENKGKNYLINRYWKVYYNLDDALEVFEKFDQSKLETIKDLGYYN